MSSILNIKIWKIFTSHILTQIYTNLFYSPTEIVILNN